MIDTDLRELEKLFLALADRTRLRLLALMDGGEVAVGFLAEQLGESQPKVSRHLAYLRGAGVVYTRRDGKWIYYGISYPEEAALRRILETAVRSIPAMTANGDYAPFTSADIYTEMGSAENNIYDQTDTYRSDAVNDEDVRVETNLVTLEDVAFFKQYEMDDQPYDEAEEMDVFLL